MTRKPRWRVPRSHPGLRITASAATGATGGAACKGLRLGPAPPSDAESAERSAVRVGLQMMMRTRALTSQPENHDAEASAARLPEARLLPLPGQQGPQLAPPPQPTIPAVRS